MRTAPLPSKEPLGLAWFLNAGTFFWSWKGTDGKYYISELFIPIFGGTGKETAAIQVDTGEGSLAELTVFDVSGRHVETLNRGIINSGGNTFDFAGPPGIYTVRLTVGESLRTSAKDLVYKPSASSHRKYSWAVS